MQKENLKFVFFGTPEVASKTLEILKNNGYLPSLIVTAPDKPQGRKMLITSPKAKLWAIENNTECLQPEKINEEFISKLKQEEYDLFIVVAYGKILPQTLIDIPKIMTLNIHYSLLPKYRGASPVESAILNGEKETGVSIQKMELKMDTGPILAEEKTQIRENEKAEELKERLIGIGGNLLVKILPDLKNNSFTLKEQKEEDATYCKKINKENGLISFPTTLPHLATGSPSAQDIYNKFKAYHKWPRIYFIENGKRTIITDAELKDGKFIIKKVIPEGKKETFYKETPEIK